MFYNAPAIAAVSRRPGGGRLHWMRAQQIDGDNAVGVRVPQSRLKTRRLSATASPPGRHTRHRLEMEKPPQPS